MKGAIICCYQDLVVKKFGLDKWGKIPVSVGQGKNQMLTELQDADDAVLKVIGSVCKTTGAALMQAVDAFDDYRGNVYSSRFYNPYYIKHKTTGSFALVMEDLQVITNILFGPIPPCSSVIR